MQIAPTIRIARPTRVLPVALSAALAVLMTLMPQAGAQQPPASEANQPVTQEAARLAAEAALASNADWPCVQHKQPVLTAAQMWDGREVAADGKRSEDEQVRKLVPVLVSRRISLDEAGKDIKTFADSLPSEQRDAKLAELFEAVLAEINTSRSSVMNGIERFQRSQVLRSKKLETDGTALAELQKTAEADLKNQDAARLAQEAQTRYDWDARVFQERQKNMPIACEIPVLIEQRAFALAQAIRALMAD